MTVVPDREAEAQRAREVCEIYANGSFVRDPRVVAVCNSVLALVARVAVLERERDALRVALMNVGAALSDLEEAGSDPAVLEVVRHAAATKKPPSGARDLEVLEHQDYRVETFTRGDGAVMSVRVTHLPTGRTAFREGGSSGYAMRRECLEELGMPDHKEEG